MSYPITKEVKKRLAEYGAKITTPGYVPGQPVKLTDEQLAGAKTDKRGQPIQRGQSYYLAPAPAINHTRRLADVYQRGGWPAVEVYLQPFMTKEYAAKQLAARAAEVPGQLGESAGNFEPLPLIDADLVQDEVRSCEPVKNVDIKIDTLLPGPLVITDELLADMVLQGEPLAEYQVQAHLVAEAGHPGPFGECPAARQCAGSCGACLN